MSKIRTHFLTRNHAFFDNIGKQKFCRVVAVCKDRGPRVSCCGLYGTCKYLIHCGAALRRRKPHAEGLEIEDPPNASTAAGEKRIYDVPGLGNKYLRAKFLRGHP